MVVLLCCKGPHEAANFFTKAALRAMVWSDAVWFRHDEFGYLQVTFDQGLVEPGLSQGLMQRAKTTAIDKPDIDGKDMGCVVKSTAEYLVSRDTPAGYKVQR